MQTFVELPVLKDLKMHHPDLVLQISILNVNLSLFLQKGLLQGLYPPKTVFHILT